MCIRDSIVTERRTATPTRKGFQAQPPGRLTSAVSGVLAASAGSVSDVGRAPALDTELAKTVLSLEPWRLVNGTHPWRLSTFDAPRLPAACFNTWQGVGANRPIVRYSLVGSGQTVSHKEPGCVE